MQGSTGRKMVSIMRGPMMLCDLCYDEIVDAKLVDERNFCADYETMFDLICVGCEDLNRPLVDDMLGSAE